MSQRNPPPLPPPGNTDEAPTPAPTASPPRRSYPRVYTPTAFTPQGPEDPITHTDPDPAGALVRVPRHAPPVPVSRPVSVPPPVPVSRPVAVSPPVPPPVAPAVPPPVSPLVAPLVSPLVPPPVVIAPLMPVPAPSAPASASPVVAPWATMTPTPPLDGVVPAAISGQPVALRAELPRAVRAASAHVVRSRAYAFVLDAKGVPIEMGSGRFAKAYLGEERWLESKTDFRRPVVIKILQKGVSDDDRMRFQIEKELLERVQGHPNIIGLHASGEADDPEFIPSPIRDKVENDFMILERMDLSLEERLKGARARGRREDLLAFDMSERLFRVLDYMIPLASAIEFAHLVKNVCHRDIKPANVLLGLPSASLRGASLEVRLADFNVGKVTNEDVTFQMTQMKGVPGTLFFQSPEQETNILELLVNVVQGSAEVEFFEDFYIQIAKNDQFSLFNRDEEYTILYSDRSKKRVVLDRPFREQSEVNVRSRIRKSVGRPADIYSLGALFYYLISGAYANPKTLYDALHKFVEYEAPDQTNTIDGYMRHEYGIIESLRAPKQAGGANVAPADRFFTYKHYLDGNGDLIDARVMRIIARCMIRNKPDSYCQAHDIETEGISELVQDLVGLYEEYGFHPATGSTQLARRGRGSVPGSGVLLPFRLVGSRLWWLWRRFVGLFQRRR